MKIVTIPYGILIIGDLKFRVNKTSDVDDRRFCRIFDYRGLRQPETQTRLHRRAVISRESSSVTVSKQLLFVLSLSD